MYGVQDKGSKHHIKGILHSVCLVYGFAIPISEQLTEKCKLVSKELTENVRVKIIFRLHKYLDFVNDLNLMCILT